MHLYCFVKHLANQTLTKMSPADAEDTFINNLFHPTLYPVPHTTFRYLGSLGLLSIFSRM